MLSTLRRSAPLTAILLLAAALRFWGITWGLHNATIERRVHPDEWVVYWLFKWFGAEHNLDPCPAYPHQCFFDWGMAYPYLAYGIHTLLAPLFSLFPAHVAGPQSDPEFVQSVVAGRLTSGCLSVFTVWLAYLLAVRLYSFTGVGLGQQSAVLSHRRGPPTVGPETQRVPRPAPTECAARRIGLVAALIVALSTLLIQLGHFATPDSTTEFFLVLTLLLIVRAADRPRLSAWFWAGVALGIAAGSEYHMVLLFAPLIAAWWLSGSRRVSSLIWAGVAAAGAFLILNPYLLVDISAFVSATEHTLRIRTVDSGLQYGDRWKPYAPIWLFVVRYPLGYGEGFVMTIWLLFGLAYALVRRTRGDILLLCWIVPYFLLVTLEPAKFMRYSAPLLVPLAILAARALIDVASRLPSFGRAAIAALAIASACYTGVYASAYTGMFSSPDPRIVIGKWLAHHAPPHAAVAYEEIPDGVVNLPYFQPNSFRVCVDQYHLGRLRGVRYIALDEYTGEEQTEQVHVAMKAFVGMLAQPPFHLRRTVHYEPTFLGLRFPIDGSPHDFRYEAHEIHVYSQPESAEKTGKYCFTTIDQAAQALYVPPSRAGY